MQKIFQWVGVISFAAIALGVLVGGFGLTVQGCYERKIEQRAFWEKHDRIVVSGSNPEHIRELERLYAAGWRLHDTGEFGTVVLVRERK